MIRRLQSSVIDAHPDLVIWQVGTNAVLRNLDPTETANLVEDGVTRIQAAGADLVAGRSAIFAARHRASREREPDDKVARPRSPNSAMSGFSRASR